MVAWQLYPSTIRTCILSFEIHTQITAARRADYTDYIAIEPTAPYSVYRVGTHGRDRLGIYLWSLGTVVTLFQACRDKVGTNNSWWGAKRFEMHGTNL